MEHFEVILPSSTLTPYVKQYWFLKIEDSEGAQRILPFGHPIVTFHKSRAKISFNNVDTIIESTVSGLYTRYSDIKYNGYIDSISIVLEPAGAMLFFNKPLYELTNLNIKLSDFNDPCLSALDESVLDASDNQAIVALIEDYLIKRIQDHDYRNYNRMAAAIQSTQTNQAKTTDLAETACLSYRQFDRLFKENIGIKAKEFLRIIRFQKASKVLQIQPHDSLSQIALECNYCDKSHLIKEFNEFTGLSPQKYLARCDLFSQYHSLFRSAYLNSNL